MKLADVLGVVVKGGGGGERPRESGSVCKKRFVSSVNMEGFEDL